MPDHNLRLLVGHANLLDSLMLELADAEREQESWFNQSVRSAQQPSEKASTESNKHIQWADTIAEEDGEDDYYESSSDEESDLDEDEDEDIEMADVVSLRRVPSHNSLKAMPQSPRMEVVEIDMDDDFEEEYDDDEEEDYAQLTLTRSPSHHSISSPPPELEHDSDESSEDEAMPPSPPSTMLPTFEQKQKESQSIANAATNFYNDEVHYMPPRNPARLVTAISVY